MPTGLVLDDTHFWAFTQFPSCIAEAILERVVIVLVIRRLDEEISPRAQWYLNRR